MIQGIRKKALAIAGGLVVSGFLLIGVKLEMASCACGYEDALLFRALALFAGAIVALIIGTTPEKK